MWALLVGSHWPTSHRCPGWRCVGFSGALLCSESGFPSFKRKSISYPCHKANGEQKLLTTIPYTLMTCSKSFSYQPPSQRSPLNFSPSSSLFSQTHFHCLHQAHFPLYLFRPNAISQAKPHSCPTKTSLQWLPFIPLDVFAPAGCWLASCCLIH